MMKDNILLLQSVLRILRYDIVLDGILGPQTARCWLEFWSPSSSAGDSIRKICNLPQFFVDHDTLDRKLTLFAKQYSVPLSFLESCVDTENTDLGPGYLIGISGKHVGIGQFDQPTWKLVMSDPFSKALDIDKALTAICRLYRANKVTFNRSYPGKDFSDAVAYLYHNQGAPGARFYFANGILKWPKQSKKAKAFIAKV